MDTLYDEINPVFTEQGGIAGLDALIASLRSQGDHHALFRALLLQKRVELNLPLVNPGELKNATPEARKAYEDFVEKTCREIGRRYLDDNNIPQAWRYYRTVGEKEPVIEALEKLDIHHASEDDIQVALEGGVHPKRGFEMVLTNFGICRGITTFDSEFSTDLSDKQHAAALLVRALYKELVVGVSRSILERFGELPPETDLVELIRHRPWLFENDSNHADPQHVSSVSRIGLICTDASDLIMALSIAEYGRMLSTVHQPIARPPFEGGFQEHARFARALLGQGVEEAIAHFRARLTQYSGGVPDRIPAEMVVLLLWRTGRQSDALDVWQQYLVDYPPELPGIFIPSFYELCLEARAHERLADIARRQDDTSVWAAAKILERGFQPPPVAKSSSEESLS